MLETLPVREWASQFSEVIKTGLLAGGRLWDLVQRWEPGRGTPEERLELIRRCAAYKARIVAEDPTEQGIRAVLNLGHSIGHALEGERPLPRLQLTAKRSRSDCCLRCGCRSRFVASIRLWSSRCVSLLELHELPTAARNVDPEAVLEAMRRDKKARGGRVRFALLERVGKPVFGVDPGDDLISQAVGRAIVA